jgi:hypothetical protein
VGKKEIFVLKTEQGTIPDRASDGESLEKSGASR